MFGNVWSFSPPNTGMIFVIVLPICHVLDVGWTHRVFLLFEFGVVFDDTFALFVWSRLMMFGMCLHVLLPICYFAVVR